MPKSPLAETDRYARPRRQRCDSPLCSQYGREWTIHPRHVGEGLVTWDVVQCAECGATPVIVREPSTTVVTVQSPPITVDFGPEPNGGYPAGVHNFASPDELRSFAAECMGVPVEQVIVELSAVSA